MASRLIKGLKGVAQHRGSRLGLSGQLILEALESQFSAPQPEEIPMPKFLGPPTSAVQTKPQPDDPRVVKFMEALDQKIGDATSRAVAARRDGRDIGDAKVLLAQWCSLRAHLLALQRAHGFLSYQIVLAALQEMPP